MSSTRINAPASRSTGAFRQHDRQTLVNGIDAFIGESEDNHAGLVEYAEGRISPKSRSNVMMMLWSESTKKGRLVSVGE